ncbi:hypothetical protein TNIN_259411 [Trichonephila inaurata madagascariensis]|uniref:Uncharacterized protein n=1 Tax=Trichonephila inaurata madagascariensis TaxID=2747483 RepID=A0A8X6XZN4_9ARAC|nr:hypothetical protein TNIN_259411 [Trichonephila inaurata madagascariensis]
MDTVYFKIIYSSVDTTTTTTTWIFQEIVNLRTKDDIENSDITTYSTSVTGLLGFASKKSKRIFYVVPSNKRMGHRLLVLIGPISCREELVMPQTVSICLIFAELVRCLKRSNTRKQKYYCFLANTSYYICRFNISMRKKCNTLVKIFQ